jgi:hypothetical protein
MELHESAIDLLCFSVLSPKLIEKQQQILRLTTPKLKSAWGPVRSG